MIPSIYFHIFEGWFIPYHRDLPLHKGSNVVNVFIDLHHLCRYDSKVRIQNIHHLQKTNADP